MKKRLFLTLMLMAGVPLAVQSPANAILNGTPDAGRHPYVGIIFNSDIYACTASAISPTVLVTAAHCVTQGQGTRFRVSFKEKPDGTSVGVYDGTGYRITQYCDTCGPGLPDFASPDVAVVVLDQPVTLPRYAKLPSPRTVDKLPLHQTLTLVGYGTNDYTVGGGHPQGVIDRNKRTTTAELLSAGTIANQFIKFNSTGGQSGVCLGDSGGPELIGDTVIGVTSFVNGSKCSSVDYGNRLDLPQLLAAIQSFER